MMFYKVVKKLGEVCSHQNLLCPISTRITPMDRHILELFSGLLEQTQKSDDYFKTFLDHSSSLIQLSSVLEFIKLCKKTVQIPWCYFKVRFLLWSDCIDVQNKFLIKWYKHDWVISLKNIYWTGEREFRFEHNICIWKAHVGSLALVLQHSQASSIADSDRKYRTQSNCKPLAYVVPKHASKKNQTNKQPPK